MVYQPVGFVIFLIAGMAETHRTPFDLPEAESELVAGFHTEYSGMKFGMFFVGEYVSMVVIACRHHRAVPRRLARPAAAADRVVPAEGDWLLLCFFMLIRGSLPRPRFDQLMGVGWKVMLPAGARSSCS